MTQTNNIQKGEVTIYILQQNLFSFEEWIKMEEDERLELFFADLDLRPYVKILQSSSPKGRTPIDREAILRAFLAAPQLGIDTFTCLHERLKSDLTICGLVISMFNFGFKQRCSYFVSDAA